MKEVSVYPPWIMRKTWSPYCQARAMAIQQQHNTTTATTAIMSVVFVFLGSSGSGAGAGLIGGVSIGSSKQWQNNVQRCVDYIR